MLGNVAELGRTPVAGLLQPAMELALVLTDRAELLGAEGDTVAARAAVREATGLASASRDASLGERLIDLEEELAGG